MRLILSCTLAAPLALLAACGDDAAPVDDTQRSATGEVLEGTISDSMLPLATVRSQPPLQNPEEAPGDQAPRDPGPAAPLQPFGGAAAGDTTPAAEAGDTAPTAPAETPAPAAADASID